MASPGGQPHEDHPPPPARCTRWRRLVLVHFQKVLAQIFPGLLLGSRQKQNEEESKQRNKPIETKDQIYHSA